MHTPYGLIYACFNIVILGVLFVFLSVVNVNPERWKAAHRFPGLPGEYSRFRARPHALPCNHPNGNANQELHRTLNEQDLDSLVLRTPALVEDRANFSIVLLVITAVKESEQRATIRRLWASKDESELQRSGRSVVIFLLGRSSDLDTEAAEHGDVLQVDVEDTYRNLVYKIEAGLRWVKERLRAEFVAKIDSDTVVHIDRLYPQLVAARRHETRTEHSKPWIACVPVHSGNVIRNVCSNWYVSPADFANATYPTYCNGPGYVLEWRALERIVEEMGKHGVMEVEDVFLTGVVARGAGVQQIPLKGVIEVNWVRSSLCSNLTKKPRLALLPTHFQLSNHYKNWSNLTAAWAHLKRPPCRVEQPATAAAPAAAAAAPAALPAVPGYPR